MNRVGYIDVARGISIILVVAFHSNLKVIFPGFLDAMGLFRMPLFFFLSGVFFNFRSGAKKFVVLRIDALLKPYFITLFLVLTYSVIFQGDEFFGQFLGILYGNGDTIKWSPMWFLTHLFVVHLFCYFVLKYFEFQNWSVLAKFTVVFIMFAVGCYFLSCFWNKEINIFNNVYFLVGLPFSIDLVLISSSFFLMGNFLRKQVVYFQINNFYLLISVFIFLVVCLFTDSKVDLNKRIYSYPLFSLLASVSGIYFVLCFSKIVSGFNVVGRILSYIGESSLFILIFHMYIGIVSYKVLVEYLESDVLISIVAFIISIGFSLVIKEVVSNNRVLSALYLPLKRK